MYAFYIKKACMLFICPDMAVACRQQATVFLRFYRVWRELPYDIFNDNDQGRRFIASYSLQDKRIPLRYA